jgi:hypothetical protein
MRMLFASLVFGAFIGASQAQDHATIRGVGLATCGQFAEMYRARPEDTNNIFLAWAMGFVSGMNNQSPDQFFDLADKSPDQMSRFLRGYCDKHPLVNFHDAVVVLAKDLPLLWRSAIEKPQKGR